MQERNKVFVSPINPFTKRQAEVLEGLVNGFSQAEVADNLGIARATVKRHVCGTYGYFEPGMNDAQAGIFGVIEKYCGTRPYRIVEALSLLVGDVVFFETPKTTK